MNEPNSQPDLAAPWRRDASEPDQHGTFTSTVDGVLVGVDDERLWLRADERDHDGERDVTVSHHLPREVELQPLLGHAVRATMVAEEGNGESHGLTLVLSSPEGRVWLIARSGTVHSATHVVSTSCGEPSLHAALSQRPLGPLVIGTAELQWLVPVGGSALLSLPSGAVFRALLVDRRPDGTATYVIADECLFADRAS